MTPVQRFLSPSYSDGLQAPRRSLSGGKLPSPREISALIHEDHDVETVTITHLLMQWGQFIDHDITSSSQSRGFNGSVPRCCKDGGKDFVNREFMHPECMPISVPSSDRFYGPLGVRCLEFVRSSPAPKDDCSLGWREQFNQVSAYLDGSPLYGSSARQSDKLRLFRNGMLQYGRVQQHRPLLPPERSRKDELCRGGAVSTDCFKSGDNRVNEHPGLVAAHIVWLRQHNRMATELSHLNPHWSDEKIYQETRKIIGAMIQHITYKEFLPIVLGSEVMRLFDLDLQKKGFYHNYNTKVNPSPASSFGSAAFRFGHSLVQSSMVRFDRHHQPISNNVSLHDELTNPSNIWSISAVDRLLIGMLNQPIQKRDEFITEELTNHLFQTPQFPFGMDLAAINIQRGRDHGLPAYTDWREPCGLTAILEFDHLFRVMPSRVVRKLQDLYRNIDDIDLFTGGMAERPVVGGLVGPTFACIIAQQFANLRKGDRFWYENGAFDSSFTPAQLQQIRRITLAQILCKTLDTIDTVQPFVFMAADQRDNRRISCSNGIFNNFDISAWLEIDPAQDNNIDFEKKEKVKKKPEKQSIRIPNTKPTDKEDFKTTSSTKVKTKPLPLTMTNSTLAENITTKRNLTLGLNKQQDKMVTKIDDKLDFKNKSKRYDNPQSYRSTDKHGPQNQYHDYDDDKYSDDEVFQQAVVVNNNRYQRPHKHNRPVIAVTENIDKFTYLINYVPRPTSIPWLQTTKRTYNDRDVVKVTYQNYDETYRRPQQQYDHNSNHHVSTYYNNRLVGKPLQSYDDYRRQRPDLLTSKNTDYNLASSARSSDYDSDISKATSTQRPTKENDDLATTEMSFKLITFSHLGTYDKESGRTNIDKTKNIEDSNVYSKDFTLDNDKDYIRDDIMTDSFMTSIPPRISTFFPNNKDLRRNLFNRPLEHIDEKRVLSDKLDSEIIPGRYYYAANVLHRYHDVDATLTKKNNTEIDINNIPILKENYNSPGRPDEIHIPDTDEIQERSSVDNMASLDDYELLEPSEKEGKVRIVKPNDAPKHAVAFHVIPSENSPSTWAVYEEKSEPPEPATHTMPTVHSDPQALSELPRPINLVSLNKNKKRKPHESMIDLKT